MIKDDYSKDARDLELIVVESIVYNAITKIILNEWILPITQTFILNLKGNMQQTIFIKISNLSFHI